MKEPFFCRASSEQGGRKAHRLGCFEDVAEAEREREVRQMVCAPSPGQHSCPLSLSFSLSLTYTHTPLPSLTRARRGELWMGARVHSSPGPHPRVSTSPQRGSKPSFPRPLICTTSRRIQASSSTNQGHCKRRVDPTRSAKCDRWSAPQPCVSMLYSEIPWWKGSQPTQSASQFDHISNSEESPGQHQPSAWEQAVVSETPNLHNKSPDSGELQYKSRELQKEI